MVEDCLGTRTASNLPYWGISLNIARDRDYGEEAKDKDGGDLQGTEEHDPWCPGMVNDESGSCPNVSE